MTNIQNARINSHIDSLDLEQDLAGILESHATDNQIEDIKSRVNEIV